MMQVMTEQAPTISRGGTPTAEVELIKLTTIFRHSQLNASEKTPYDFLVEEGPVVYPGEGPK